MNDVRVHPREVVREALHRNAQAVIAARNDPTGDAEPTRRDIADACLLRYVLGQIEIKLVDYLIVGEKIKSMAERGLM